VKKEHLERYNHIHYDKKDLKPEGFVDFLYKNTEPQFPSVDEHAAWNKVSQKINTSERKSFGYLISAMDAAIFR
jgi:hypothetical protein